MKNFNVLKDPWISMDKGKIVGAAEALLKSPEVRDVYDADVLAEVGILRFLMAIVGDAYQINDIEVCEKLLRHGEFDERLNDYLAEYDECFELFREEGKHPFMQRCEAKNFERKPASYLFPVLPSGDGTKFYKHVEDTRFGLPACAKGLDRKSVV